MKDRPLVLGLLIGLIVVLIVSGVSLVVRLNNLSEEYKKEVAKSINAQKAGEDFKTENALLKKENLSFKDDLAKMTVKVDELKMEIAKMEKLKEKLEENLKDELIKKDELLKQQNASEAVPTKTKAAN